MGTERTTLQLSDERKRLIDEATVIVSDGPDDDPPRSDVIESKENMEVARGELDPAAIQQFNTDALALHYRTSVDSRWR